jgi:hypothetical protein
MVKVRLRVVASSGPPLTLTLSPQGRQGKGDLPPSPFQGEGGLRVVVSEHPLALTIYFKS